MKNTFSLHLVVYFTNCLEIFKDQTYESGQYN